MENHIDCLPSSLFHNRQTQVWSRKNSAVAKRKNQKTSKKSLKSYGNTRPRLAFPRISRSPKLPQPWRELNLLTDLFATIIHSPNPTWAKSLIWASFITKWRRKLVPSLSPNARRPVNGRNLGPNQNQRNNMAACHIKKNLAALRQFPRVALNNIRDLPEAFKPVSTFLSSEVKRFHK